jgi:galactose mutarotase-like enzyme
VSGGAGSAPASARPTTWRGLDALELDNGMLRVTVVPWMGGHIAELVDVGAGRDLLWHNPRATPRPAPYGAHFDDWWSGGWDEIFPSGDQGRLHGEPLPYMGELWCVPWTAACGIDGGGEAAWIEASAFGTIAAARFTRRLELRRGEPVLRARYRIENLDVRPLPWTWGIHPAFAVGPAHRMDLPAGDMVVGVSSSPELGGAGEGYRWPRLPDATAPGGFRDVSRIRGPEAVVFGGHWASLQAGWVALTDTAARRGIAIAFDPAVFPNAWLWQVYGGWRGHHHLALEPWTSRPMDLEGALAAGTARTLDVGKTLQTEVRFALHAGLDRVRSVELRGDATVVR